VTRGRACLACAEWAVVDPSGRPAVRPSDHLPACLPASGLQVCPRGFQVSTYGTARARVKHHDDIAPRRRVALRDDAVFIGIVLGCVQVVGGGCIELRDAMFLSMPVPA